ncbi:MAG: asparaginase [Burkholderiales bacterium]|nr:asparaginase [Burkholderiales bacterium]
MNLALLAEVTRGDVVESVHYGAVAVVDAQGLLLYYAGDPHLFTFTRSTLKPFQAVPFTAGGGIARFGFTIEQTALMCASHSGEARHVSAVQDMLAKIGCEEHHLQCGCHEPIDESAQGRPYNQLHNNCSGKHAGFLAYCVQHGLPLDTYLDPQHSLQREVRRSVAHFAGIDESTLQPVIDGCSAPNYGLPLSRLAYAYARLAQGSCDDRYGDATATLFQAMTSHPEMVSGKARFDAAVMQAASGDWVAKGGAEGVQAIGVHSAGLGIAIKVADGNARALYPTAVAVLQQLGLRKSFDPMALGKWVRPQLSNLRGLHVGEIRASVNLMKA